MPIYKNSLRTLPVEAATEILDGVQSNSVVQQLATKMTISGNGKEETILTGIPEAQWVSEGQAKPVGSASMTNRTVMPYKAAVVVPVSAELIEDDQTVYNTLVNKLPESLGRLFDTTVLNSTAPGSNFDVLSDVTEVQVNRAGSKPRGFYGAAVDALSHIGQNRGSLNGFVVNGSTEGKILDERDENNRPIFTSNYQAEGSIGNVLGRPLYLSRDLDDSTEALAGDWTSASWGMTPSGLTFKVSDQATLNIDGEQVSLWQNNLVGLLVEARFAFAVTNKEHFVRLVDSAADNGEGEDESGN